MLNEFKKFVLRGNVVDLAVGVAIGAAFTSVVNAFVRDFLDPLIKALYGGSKLSEAYFSLGSAKFLYGDFINAIITFLIVATAVFFVVVQPINKLTTLAIGSKETKDSTTRKCPHCLSEVANEATRCKYCTSKLVAKST